MAATHSYPTSKCQQIVLAGLGMTADNYTEAERLFDDIGIVVVAIRQGRKSVPSIVARKPTGYAGSDDVSTLFNRNYADVIRTNLAEYCNAEFLKSITPIAQPVVAEQKEDPMTNLAECLQYIDDIAESSMYGGNIAVFVTRNFDDYTVSFARPGMPPHTYVSAPTLEQLLTENPELVGLHWIAVEEEDEI